MFNRLLFICFFLVLIFVFQTSRVLAIFEVSPNLFLIFFLIIYFGLNLSKFGFLSVLAILVSFCVIWFFWFGFWFMPVFVFSALLLILFTLRSFLTGEPLVDFVLSLIAVTSGFWFWLCVLGFSQWSWFIVFGELVYNLILGLAIWSILKRFKRYETVGS